MQDERWNEIKELFDKALALAPEERTRYLQHACGGDDSVRLVVESLIRSHEKSGSFMESPAYETAANLLADPHELKPGEMVAHYRIRSLIPY